MGHLSAKERMEELVARDRLAREALLAGLRCAKSVMQQAIDGKYACAVSKEILQEAKDRVDILQQIEADIKDGAPLGPIFKRMEEQEEKGRKFTQRLDDYIKEIRRKRIAHKRRFPYVNTPDL